MLAFCNAADTLKRNHLTLRISFDEGLTWKKYRLIEASDENKKNDVTAYSDIVMLNKKEIGVLYERNGYAQIVFTLVNWKK
jgi:sialidase-1